MKTVFAVDDSDTNLTMVETALEEQYRVITIPSAAKMFEMLEKITPDIILLDIEMPEMDGFETIKKLKTNYLWDKLPVIFLTGRIDEEIEARCLEMGAVDFITKPFSTIVLINRIKTHLNIAQLIRDRTDQLIKLQNSIVSVLADMVENRDKRTIGHIDRISLLTQILMDELMAQGIYADETKEWDSEKFIFSSRMHDLGKISISDIILNKPGKLTPDEYEKVKEHATEGERIINEIIARTGEGEHLLNAKLFAAYHHEHWDGTGYPRGLKGKEIPLHGRIMAITDVYDALVTERSYKEALSHDEAVNVIIENAGIQFDPLIVEAFKKSYG